MCKNNNIRGFTLIELLVVISIISLLSSVVLSSLNTARSKARDSARRSDAYQITLAIEFYFDANGVYPPSGGAVAPNASWSNSSDNSWDALALTLKPYLSSLAKDPLQTSNTSIWGATGQGRAYSYVNCANSYMFVYQLETANGVDPGASCPQGTLYQYGGSGANTAVKTVGGTR